MPPNMPSQTLLDRVWAFTSPEEGCEPGMYLDTAKPVSRVTVGCGFMLPSQAAAQALPFDQPPEVVARDFATIRAMSPNPGYRAAHYLPLTRSRLPLAEVRRLFDTRVRMFAHVIEGYFPEFYTYPQSWQVGMLDMSYNLGAGAFCTAWPGLKQAIKARDPVRAAKESHRAPPVSEARNRATAALFLAAT